MAARVTPDHVESLSHDEQAALEGLLDKPLTDLEEEKQGWSIPTFPAAFVNPYIAPLLVTSFINLCKNTYSLISIKRCNEGGNFCGHNPAEPRFVMQHHAYFAKQENDDLGNKRRPQILYDIVERVKAYYHDPDVMPMLHIANSDKRKSDRKRRSETREAVVNLLSVMIMNMDLNSFRVGQPMAGGGFFNYSLEWLAEKAKISFSRAKRAMSDLNDAMIISSFQYREMINKDRKEYIAHNAARLFDSDFFTILEINPQKLGEARKVSYQKQVAQKAAHQIAEAEKEQAIARLNMKRIYGKNRYRTWQAQYQPYSRQSGQRQ